MADTQPTKLKFLKIIYLCCLAITHPKKFIKEEENDNTIRKNFPPVEEKEHAIYIVRRAFWSSLGLIISSAFFGGLVGLFVRIGRPDGAAVVATDSYKLATMSGLAESLRMLLVGVITFSLGPVPRS